MSAVLELSGLQVQREAGVLLDVPVLEMGAGEIVVVTGATDSGKTLLASVLCGRVEASRGSQRLSGRPLSGGPAARRRAGLAVSLGDGGRIAGCSVEEALRLAGRARAAAALERFALLGQRRDTPAELLSGGEHQLLGVVCAWCAEPRLLVLDAPTVGLAGDVAAAVVTLAVESARDGAAVLWLDQPGAPAPAGTPAAIAAGRLSWASAAASPSPPAGSSSP